MTSSAKDIDNIAGASGRFPDQARELLDPQQCLHRNRRRIVAIATTFTQSMSLGLATVIEHGRPHVTAERRSPARQIWVSDEGWPGSAVTNGLWISSRP